MCEHGRDLGETNQARCKRSHRSPKVTAATFLFFDPQSSLCSNSGLSSFAVRQTCRIPNTPPTRLCGCEQKKTTSAQHTIDSSKEGGSTAKKETPFDRAISWSHSFPAVQWSLRLREHCRLDTNYSFRVLEQRLSPGDDVSVWSSPIHSVRGGAHVHMASLGCSDDVLSVQPAGGICGGKYATAVRLQCGARVSRP